MVYSLLPSSRNSPASLLSRAAGNVPQPLRGKQPFHHRKHGGELLPRS